jgi:hypothetical protein
MFGGQLVSRVFEEFQQTAIQNKIVQHFGGFFLNQNKSVPANRKNEKIGSIFAFSGAEL